MPIYEYKCTECGILNKCMKSIEHRDLCPECEECSGKTERIISTPGMVWAPTSGGYR